MNIKVDIMVTVSEGDLQLKMGKALTTFTYKGQDKFVFKTAELKTLFELAEAAAEKLNSLGEDMDFVQ